MNPFSIRTFKGAAPGIESRLLPEGYSITSLNGKYLNGALSSWFEPSTTATPTKAVDGTVKTVFKLEYEGADYWMNWLTDVDVVRAPFANESKLYWTGDGEPREASFADATTGPDYPTTFYVLGVWQPETAPTITTPTGGAGAATTRAYIYTHVTADGEEGAPSPASALTTGKVDDTWQLTALEASPPNSGTVAAATHSAGVVTVELDTTNGLRANEEITFASVGGMTDLNGTWTIASVVDGTDITIALTTAQTYTTGGTWARVANHNVTLNRFYRTKDGGSTSEYYYVGEQDSSTSTYTDTVLDADLGSILESDDWFMPPANMRGLQVMSNQSLVGYFENVVCFSEPNVAYAFPTAYQVATPDTIVGLAAYDNVVYALTDKSVWVVVGNSPGSMSVDPTNINFPCLSKRSVSKQTEGVYFSSADGVAIVGPGVAEIVTRNTIQKTEWEDGYFPSTIVATVYQGQYFGFYEDGDGVVQGFSVQRGDPIPHLNDFNYAATAIYLEETTRDLFLVNDGKIKQWDTETGRRLTYEWESRRLVPREPVNPQVMLIDADYSAFDENGDVEAQAAQRAADLAYNEAIIAAGNGVGRSVNSFAVNSIRVNGSLLRSLGETFSLRYLAVDLIVDGVVVFTKQPQSVKPFKLPGGYKSQNFTIKLNGNIDVFRIEAAGSGKGLTLV